MKKSGISIMATIVCTLVMFVSLFVMGNSDKNTLSDNNFLAQDRKIEFVEVYIYDLPEVVKTAIAEEFDFKDIVSTSMAADPKGNILIRLIIQGNGERTARFYSPDGERLDKI